MGKSVAKIMANFFLVIQGILIIDNLPKRTTMNDEYYTNLLSQAHKPVVGKRRSKLACVVLFMLASDILKSINFTGILTIRFYAK